MVTTYSKGILVLGCGGNTFVYNFEKLKDMSEKAQKSTNNFYFLDFSLFLAVIVGYLRW